MDTFYNLLISPIVMVAIIGAMYNAEKKEDQNPLSFYMGMVVHTIISLQFAENFFKGLIKYALNNKFVIDLLKNHNELGKIDKKNEKMGFIPTHDKNKKYIKTTSQKTPDITSYNPVKTDNKPAKKVKLKLKI